MVKWNLCLVASWLGRTGMFQTFHGKNNCKFTNTEWKWFCIQVEKSVNKFKVEKMSMMQNRLCWLLSHQMWTTSQLCTKTSPMSIAQLQIISGSGMCCKNQSKYRFVYLKRPVLAIKQQKVLDVIKQEITQHSVNILRR